MNATLSTTRCCTVCGGTEPTADLITQPAAPYRIGGLPGSEKIDAEVKWVAVCMDCAAANDRVLDRGYALATGRSAKVDERRMERQLNRLSA